MNSSYKLVYSEALNTWVAVAEHVSARGKKSAMCLVTAAALLAGGVTATGWALAAPPLITPPAVNQLPTGAQVAAGTVSFSQTQTATAASMAVQQSSNQAIVNWQSFNVGANARVNITQPSASSVLLNRVQSSDPSQIFGQVNANGQVFLTNPNGVYFAPGSRVDVGSFTATTHSISDSDFLSGNYNFSRNGATGSLLNEGSITSGLGGYIALLAPEVRNQGVVLAQMGGTLALAAGESYQLLFNSNKQLTNVLVTPSTLSTLIENGNAVHAPGGLIILSAQAASSLLGGVVKNTGSISATGLVNDGGTIRLTATNKIELTSTSTISADAAPNSAGNGGRIDIITDLSNASGITQVDGSISAKGGEQGGDGGFIETSATHLKIADTARVSTLAPRGQAGNWLLDPNDFEVSSTGNISGSTLSTLLAGGNVTLQAGTGTDTSTAKFGNVSTTSTKGNINIYDAVSWSANTLTLNAGYNINVGSSSAAGSLTVTGSGSLYLNPSSSSVAGYTAGGAVLMGMAASPTSGLITSNQNGFNGQINVSSTATNPIKINNVNYTVINTVAGLNAITTSAAGTNDRFDTYNNGYYVLGSDITSALTTSIIAANKFFAGYFNGFGHTINVALTNGNNGLFSSAYKYNFSNLGVKGSIASSTAGVAIGGILGTSIGASDNSNEGTISNSYNAATITHAGNSPRLAGIIASANVVTLSNVYNAGSITVTSGTWGANAGYVVGLVGFANTVIATNVYNTGAMSASTGQTVSGVAGLFGYVGGSNGGGVTGGSIITNAYNTGNITVGSNSTGIGGIFAIQNWGPSKFTNIYSSGSVTAGTGSTAVGIIGGMHFEDATKNLTTGFYNSSNASTVGGTTITNPFGTVWTNVGLANKLTGCGGICNNSSPSSTPYYSVTPLTTAQMTVSSNFTGFTFSSSAWGYSSVANSSPILCLFGGCVISNTYTGLSGGTWSTASNWSLLLAPLSSNASSYNNIVINSGSTVNFDTASVGNLTTTIANAGAISFTGSSNVTLSGAISGNGAINTAASFTGSATLSGTNTYSGGTTISGGTLKAGSATAFGTGAISVASGAALDLNGKTMTSTGVLTLNGTGISGGGALTNSSSTGGTYAGNIAGSASSIGSAVGEITASGVVSGAFALTKVGAATLSLTGSNSYTGGTTISAGTLKVGSGSALGSSGGGAISVASLAALDLNGFSLANTNTITLNGTGISSGGALINSSGTGSAISNPIVLGSDTSIGSSTASVNLSGVISGDGNLTKIGSANSTLSGINTYTGTTTVTGGGILAISHAQGLGSTDGGTIVSSTGRLVINGLSVGAEAITLNGGSLEVQSGTGSWSGPVTLGANSSVRVDSGAQLTLSNVVDGTGRLTKTSGATVGNYGTLVLTGTNTYSGGTTISAGTLQLGAGGETGSIAGNVTNNATLAFNRSDVLTYANVISGTGAVTKLANNTLTFTGNNTYSGGTTISAGTLKAGSATALGTGAISVSNGAALDLNGQTMTSTGVLTLRGTGIDSTGALLNSGSTAATYAGALALGANSSIMSGSTITSTISLTNTGALAGGGFTLTLGAPGVASADNHLYSIIDNTTAKIIKNGSFFWTFHGNNTYSGGTDINAGTIRAGSPTALGSGAITVASGGSLDLRGQTMTSIGTLSLNGPGFANLGALRNSNATAATYAGPLVLTGNANVIAQTGAIQLTHTGTITGATFGLTLGGAQGGSIAAIIGTTTGSLTKQDGGTWTLSGANTYTGGTTVSAGTLKLGSATAAGTGAIGVSSSAALDLNGQTLTSTGALTLNSTGVANGGALLNSSSSAGTYAGAVTLASDSSYGGTGAITFGSTVNSASSAAYALSSTSAGNLVFNAAVGASYALSSLSTGTGTTTLGANVTTVGAQTYGGPVVIKNSSGVTLANTNSAITFGATVNSISATSYALTLSNGTGATTFTGAIGATEAIGALTVNGTGTITLGGNVTTKGDQNYAGPVSAADGIVITANSTAGTTGILTNGYINNTNYAVAVQAAGSFPNEPSEYNIQTGTSSAIIGTTGTIRGVAAGVLFYNTTNIEGADNGMASGNGSSSWCCYNVPYLVDAGRSTLLTKISVSQRAGDGIPSRLPTKVYVYGSNTAFTTSATMRIGNNNANISNVSVLGTGYQQSNFTEIGNGTLSPALTTSGTPALGSVSFTNTTAYRYYQIAFVSAGQTTVAGSYVQPLALQAINLVGSAYAPSSVTFNGAVTASGALTVNTAGFTAANMTAGGALTINNSGTGSVSGVISTNGSNAASLVKQGDGTLTLSNTNTYTGGTTVSAGTLQLGAGVATGSIEGNVTNNATLVFNRSDDVTYAGAISGTGAVTKLAANALTFTGTNTYTGATTISAGTLQVGAGGASGAIAGNVTNNATLTFNRSGALNFSGAISGSGAVTKLGTGTTTLSGVNTYTGSTTVSTGTLAISNAAGLGDTAAGTTVASGATLDLQGVAVGAEAITLQGGTLATSTGTSSLSGTVAMSADSAVSVAGTQLTLSGVVSGTGFGLTKAGSGSLVLSGNNTYSGDTTVSAGTLAISHAAGLGGTGAGTTVASAATLDLRGVAVGAEAIALQGGTLATSTGTSSLSGTVAMSADSAVSVAGTQLTLSGVVSGIGFGLTKTGSGSLILSGTNTYTGATTVSAGTLSISNAAGLGGTGAGTSVASGASLFFTVGFNVGAEAITLNGGTLRLQSGTGSLSGTVDLAANSSISVDSGAQLTLSGLVSGTGRLTKTSLGTLVLTGTNTYTGGTTISAGTLQVGDGSTSGRITGDVSNSGALTFKRSDDLTYSGAIGGSGSVTKLEASALTLSGANTYTGGTTISVGTLKAGSATAFGTGAISVVSGAALDLNGQTMTSTGALTLRSTGIDSGGALLNSSSTGATYAGLLTLGAASSIVGGAGTIALSNTGTISGATYGLTLGGAQGGSIASIIGTTSGTVTKQDAGTWLLSGSNTYTGATTISAGTLATSSATGLGTIAGGVTVASAATLDLRGASVGAESITLNGGTLATSTGTSSLTGTVAMSADSAVSVAGTQLTLSGVVSGIGFGLTKTGSGSLILSGTNTYTGATTVSAGTLAITNASGLGTTAAGTTVASGATLDLRGVAVGAEAVTLAGGTLTASTGTSSLSGDVNLTSASTLSGAGALTLSGAITSNSNGLALLGTGAKTLSSTSNTLSTLASGSGVGALSVVNNAALTIGQVTAGGSTYSGINATDTVSVSTRTGDLTVSQNVATTSTATSYTTPALKLGAGSLSAAGTPTGGDVLLSGTPTISVGTGGAALIYSGYATTSDARTLVNSFSPKLAYYSINADSTSVPTVVAAAYFTLFRESPTTLYTLYVPGQRFTYGTPITSLNYCYSTSASSCSPVTAAGIPSTTQAAAFNNLLLDAGTYPGNPNPSLPDVRGYFFAAGNAVNIVVDPKTVTIANSAQTTTYNGLSTYSNLANAMTYTVTGLVGYDAVSSLTQTPSGSGLVASNVANAGSFTVTPGAVVLSTGKTSNYSFSYASALATVDKANLIVTAKNDSKFIGEADVSGFSGVSYRGFVAGQTASVLSGTATVARSNASVGAAGTYAGVLSAAGSTLSSNNYNISYEPGSYTIVPADQLLIRLADASTTYGTAASYTVSSVQYMSSTGNSVVDLTSRAAVNTAAFTLSDGAGGNTALTLGPLSASLSSAGQVAAGSYQVGASSITNTSANYGNTVNIVGALTVAQKTLTPVATSGLSKTYDGNTTMGSLGFGLTGLVGGDAVTATGLGTYANANAGNAKAFTVAGIGLGGTDAANYKLASNTLSATNGVITTAPLLIKANNDSKTYDASAYAATAGVSYSGFVNSETATDLGGTLAYGGSAIGAVNVGNYVITPSGQTSSNYAITFGNGSLYISPADVSVSATNVALTGTVGKVYDGTNVATLSSNNYVITGWQGSDGATISQTTGTYDNANAGKNKLVSVTLASSDYSATNGTLLSNYNLPTAVSGNVGLITPKSVTVTNAARSTTYDGTSYAALALASTYSVGDMVGSDALASVTQTPSGFSGAASGAANAGTFTVAPSAAVLSTGTGSNYSFSYVASTHTVNQAPLSAALVGTTSKAFDGSTAATLAAGNFALTGFVSTEGANVTQTAGTFLTAAAGSRKTVTAALGSSDFAANSGTLLSNYILPTSASGNIGTVTQTAFSVGETRSQFVAVLTPTVAPAASSTYAAPALTVVAASSAAVTASRSAVPSSAAVRSSSGVSVSTISSASIQVPGLVTVLVPTGTSTAGSGFVIALPEQVVSSGAVGVSVQVTLPNNEPLPAWIRYDAATQTLVTSAVPAGAFPLSVVVTVGGQSTVIQISESQSSI